MTGTSSLNQILAQGPIADRPADPGVWAGTTALYWANDEDKLYVWDEAAAAWGSLSSADTRWNAAGFAPVVNVASFVCFRYAFVFSVSLPAALTGSLFSAIGAAAASTTFTIQKNGASIGTLVWAASGTIPTVTFAAGVSFVAGDILSVVGPASADANLSGVTLSFLGVK